MVKLYLKGKDAEPLPCVELDDGTVMTIYEYLVGGGLTKLEGALTSYGVHSYTPAQVDAFIDGVSTVVELKALLKVMAKCIIAYAEYFKAER